MVRNQRVTKKVTKRNTIISLGRQFLFEFALVFDSMVSAEIGEDIEIQFGNHIHSKWRRIK